MRLRSASVAPAGSAWSVGLVIENDNANASLPTSWRRWWHCEIRNLSPAGETLQVTVSNAGYTDVILPVWAISADGVNFGSYARVPLTATPVVNGSTHRFTLQTPPGAVALRLAKYFPYTVSDKAALLASLSNHPSGRVRSIASLGTSWLGRPIEVVELTDPAVPDTSKTRVWIHAGIHPSETTSYFTVEGLFTFLLSSDPQAALLLRNAILDVVPMANPDGVFLGNYRTNSRSANLEDEWASPYNSPEREIIALRTRIEGFMGTTAAPGSNPIEVLLNLHSSHDVSFPFHFQHVANAAWNPTSNNSGVLPSVNALEGAWIAAFRTRSQFVARGTTMSSTAGAPSRPFVESMMHDRWSANAAWTGAPNNLPQVMAITFEGTYGRGPDGVTWNTPDDYRLAGQQMGHALADYFAFPQLTTATPYGASCNGLGVSAIVIPGSGVNTARLAFSGAPLNAPGFLFVGTQRALLPLPPPFTCSLLTLPLANVPLTYGPSGTLLLSVPVPLVSGLLADLQGVAVDLNAMPITVSASAGVEVLNNF